MIRSPKVILALLTALNLLNYLDRLVVSAVGVQMSDDLHLTGKQFGLIGSAFLWGYLLCSPLVGLLAAFVARKRLVAAGIALWSLATSASGLASTFAPLFAVRAVVGVGEASYASISPALLDDITPLRQRGRVLGIFYAAIPVGSALGYVVGGLLGKAVGWRLTFVFCGLPGVLLAALMLAIYDPGTTQKTSTDQHQTPASAPADKAAPSFAAVVKALAGSRIYSWTLAGYIAQTFALGGFSMWAPMYMVKTYALENDRATTTLGGILVVTGFAGSFLGGALADRLPGKDRLHVALLVCAISAVAATPFAFWCVFAPTPFAFFATIAIAELGIFTSVSPVNGLFLSSTPNAMRTIAMGTSILLSHLFGDVCSVPLVGIISDKTTLRTGMAILPVALAVCALLWGVGFVLERKKTA